VARPFPRAVEGRLESINYDVDTRVLVVEVSDGDGCHEFSAPKWTYPNGVQVKCDGVEVEHTPGEGAVGFTCTGSRFELGPAGG